MKKRVWVSVLLAAALLSACAAEGARAPDDPAEERSSAAQTQPSAPQERAAAPTVETMGAASVVSSGPELTEEEVLAAYDRAVAAYEWFDLTTLPCGGAELREDGVEYRRVEYAGFDTLDDLRTYLRGLFSQSVIDRLLQEGERSPRYRDINGQLCVRPGGREAEPGRSAASAAVERQKDGSYRVNVLVDLLDEERLTVSGVQCYSFPYCRENGRWVFTEFQLVY